MSYPVDDARVCIICGLPQRFMFEYQKYDYFRCPDCAHVTTYPFPNSSTISQHYERKFKQGNYQQLRDSSEEYQPVYRSYVQLLEHILSSSSTGLHGMKVLDVGCFTGELLELYQSRGADVYGLELQSQAVDIANQRLPGRVFQADIQSENFPQMQFDLITMMGVIEHVVDPTKLLQRSADLLKTGGILMVQTPNSGSFFARSMRGLWPIYAPVEHIHLFSRQSLTKAVGNAGFVDILFKPHWKKLPIQYVYNMMQNYGPEFHRLLGPVYRLLPHVMTEISLPFYIGEMILLARKKEPGTGLGT